jgi:hypothetical protein
MAAPIMVLVSAFALGCILAQLGWSLAANDASALGESTFRFLLLAAIEIVIAAAAFGGGMVAGSKSFPVLTSAKSVPVAFFSGVLTLTVAGAPYSLVPRLVTGEAQMVILIIAAAVVSAFLGALVGAAFRVR